MNPFDQLLDELTNRIAARVAERLRTPEPGMLDQAGSPLGNRRHCSAVKRRLNGGEGGAAIVGRRHLLTPEALNDELERLSGRKGKALKPPINVRAELLQELRLVRR